ncbi:sugar ABC transporter substrate-binding protein [Arthrobacter globiformis]|uniref:sugar ABC transporter substrate-binding protein n=1 Tax=Arthrobacter globiformis TaxID=1665 RepID=UPI0027854B5A|nr:sugar ABC transporter substrate-binding protein [Arthrobacter globiformis]MDQ0864499.1 ribose transport system substrate-binding protein [Arthrobacter globiformis]MDQ1060481.1 ribose transport system substrate-binding protein [Arthrobacter globiformis]
MSSTTVNTRPGRRGSRARLALACTATAAALLLTGCTTVNSSGGGSNAGASGGGGTDYLPDETVKKIVNGREIKVGFAPPILSEFYTQVEKAAQNKMKEYEDRFGVKWKWERQGALNDAHSGTETLGIVQGYIARKFDAVFVCSAANASTMQALYKQGSAKGIDFYQFNSTEELANPSQAENPTGGLSTVSNIGYDDRWQSGYLAGQYIAKQLKGQGSIIQIMGPSGSDWTKLRQLGFKKAIAEYPDMKIVGEADGGYVRDKGLTAAQDLLTKFPDVKAIYGENEDMALGAAQAIDARGLKHWDGTSGIITIGADGLVSGMDAIKAGKLTATVDVNSSEMGSRMIETLFAHEFLGQEVNQFIRIPTGVVDKSNVDWHEGVLKNVLSGPGKY